MKRFFTTAGAALLMALVLGCGPNTVQSTLVDGTYEGTGEGKNGEITVQLTVVDQKVSAVELVQSTETAGISDNAVQQIVDQVIESNSAVVDAVSGATYTSEGLIAAIRDAMKTAGAGEDQLNGDARSTAATEEPKAQIEKSYDVVIIGAGGAGLTAGITAHEAGADVVVLEKMSFVGGNTLVSGGEMNVPGSWVQDTKGIHDSVEQYAADTLAGGDHQGNPNLVLTMAENALDAAKWLHDEVGVEYQSDYLMQFGGHSVPRAIFPKGGSGYEVISKLEKHAREAGVEIEMQTVAEELVTDESGRVVGVVALQNGNQPIVYHAAKGVIIASGGFGSNVEMRMRYNAEYDERYMSTDQEGTTGDGIVMAEALGAQLVQMGNIQTYPTCSTRTGILSYVADTRFDGAILVNKEGLRFVEELDRRDVISKAILAQTGNVGYLLWDATITENSHMDNYMQEYRELEANGELFRADTLAEVARFFEIPEEALEASVERYNGFVAAGEDLDFHHRGRLTALTKAPYYIQKVAPSVHHTMGGVAIDTKAHVINTDGQIIPGLFAAGEVTGGVHGANRLGGNAITDLAVFGRIAGMNAAAN